MALRRLPPLKLTLRLEGRPESVLDDPGLGAWIDASIARPETGPGARTIAISPMGFCIRSQGPDGRPANRHCSPQSPKRPLPQHPYTAPRCLAWCAGAGAEQRKCPPFFRSISAALVRLCDLGPSPDGSNQSRRSIHRATVLIATLSSPWFHGRFLSTRHANSQSAPPPPLSVSPQTQAARADWASSVMSTCTGAPVLRCDITARVGA